MKPIVFEEELIRTLEVRSRGLLHVAGDWIPLNNQPKTRVLKLHIKECCLMPLIYPGDYESRFCAGESLESLADEILEQVNRTRETADIPGDFFRTYEGVRDGIFCRVINADKNRALLDEIPHEIHENLAIVFYYELQETWMEDATILIRNEHLELWDKSACEIKNTAWKNTIKKKVVKFKKLSQVLAEYGLFETEMMEDNPLYLLTNEQGGFGAVTAFYPDVLAKCAEELHSNLILLPSSIHEWLLLPSDVCDRAGDPDELRVMVREINRSQLEEKEILSDEIYFYDWELDRLSMI